MITRLLFLCVLMTAGPVWAADDFAQRLALAEKMLEIRPARQQLQNAVDAFIKNYMFAQSKKDQEAFRAALLDTMNSKALEKISIDAYAETFTLKELEAMVEYYSKPEARSASDKQSALNAKITPEIVRMLDQALIRTRTEAQAP